ncbi:MAG: hypothetical protein KC482_03010 [Dehalococcoidia bacterium]|nr:hypothetical protein [Dehalococcoidia bacterium]MCA9844450.1 hypothetical protein [Dehalococcoidia bacterium]MCA9852557.1 hypothetical protein [Dehalococcoidia bacterium]
MHVRRLSPIRLFGVVCLLALLVTGFVLGRNLRDSDVRAVDPLTADSPTVQLTPEWFAPTLEAELVGEHFEGKINGITLGVDDGPVPDCSKTDVQPDPSLLDGTPFDLGLDRLPAGITLQTSPRIGVCADDGRVMWVIAQLEVSPRPGVNGDAGQVQVSRWENVQWYRQQFLADRVEADTLSDRPAVLADRGASGFGSAAVFVVDEEIDGSTMLISTNVNLDILVEIAEEVYR